MDFHLDSLVCAELYIPPHHAHLIEEAHDVVHCSVSLKSLLCLIFLDQVEGVGVYLPQQLTVEIPRTFLKTTTMT